MLKNWATIIGTIDLPDTHWVRPAAKAFPQMREVQRRHKSEEPGTTVHLTRSTTQWKAARTTNAIDTA